MPDINNYYEQLVSDQLWKLNQDAEQPMDQNYIDDITCIALNSLPPCYVRNLADLSSHLSDVKYQQMTHAVEAAIQKAIQQVNRRSQQDREE